MYRTEIDNYLRKTGFREFMPKAALFDMDGVLYNSMPNHAYSWHTSMASFGIEMSEADAYAHEGMRGVETIKKIVKEQKGIEISDEESQRMYDEKSRIFATRPEAKVMEGVMELQRKMKADGLKIVVVTGSGQKSLLDRLEHNYPGFFHSELVVSSKDVKHGKPHPEPYLMGLEKAGVKPYEAMVVENAPLGVRAAVAAGIFTIAVNTGPLPEHALTDEGANVLFPSMTALAENFNQLKQAWEV